jgi:hypothetical protein
MILHEQPLPLEILLETRLPQHLGLLVQNHRRTLLDHFLRLLQLHHHGPGPVYSLLPQLLQDAHIDQARESRREILHFGTDHDASGRAREARPGRC